MDPAQRLVRTASGALRLGRGLADRVVRLTAPHVAHVVGKVVAEARPARRRTPVESRPATFTPSRREAVPEAPTTPAVTPGSVARNIPRQRPVARTSAPPRKSVPGAKLPPRRPTTA
jgi:hypothetical protein